MAELLNDSIKQQISEVFKQLKEPVHVLFFGAKQGCQSCEETRTLIEEVTALSDKLTLSIYDLHDDTVIAKQYHVDKTPTLVLAAKDGSKVIDYGIRFTGIPSGHEFTSLIQGILLLSSRDSGLQQQTRDFLKSLKDPIDLQVFVTPT